MSGINDEPPPNERSQAKRLRYWTKLKSIREGAGPQHAKMKRILRLQIERAKQMSKEAGRRRPTKTSLSWIGTSFAYLCVFCAAALMLCFVLWVASCTLEAMKGV